MPHSLPQLVTRLAGRWNLWLVLAVLAWVLTTSVVVNIVAAVIDYLARPHDTGLRVLLSLLVALVSLVWGIRILQWGWRLRVTPFAMARHVERENPTLGDRLTSAIAFLSQDENDPRNGSTTLRRVVIAEVANSVEGLPVADAAQPPQAKPALVWCGIVLGLLALAALVAPATVWTAIMRLAMPLADVAWPREVHLQFVDLPELIARGSDFAVAVKNTSGSLPDDVRVELRQVGQRTADPLQITNTDDQAWARRLGAERTFDIRALGGDDLTMPWQRVLVVDPPTIASLDVKVTAPPYSGFSGETTGKQLRMLAGSKVTWNIMGSESLGSASLQLPGHLTIAAATSGDEAQAQWIAEAPASDESPRYGITLGSARRIMAPAVQMPIEVIADRPPTIDWSASGSTEQVTARALLALELMVADDLALQNVQVGIEATAADGAALPPREMTVVDNGPQPPQIDKLPTGPAAPQPIKSEFDLTSVPVAVGTQLRLTARASDYKPQTATTKTPRELIVISDEDFAALIAETQRSLADDLQRALELERDAQQQSRRTHTDLSAADSITRLHVDGVAAATVQQRQVATLLVDPAAGVLARTVALRARVIANRMNTDELDSQLSQVIEVLARLAAGPLPLAEQRLTDSRTQLEVALAQQAAADRQQAVDTLALADSPQQAIVTALEALLDSVQQWGDTQQLIRELVQLAEAHRDLAKRSGELVRQQMRAAAEGRSDPALAEAGRRLAEEQNALTRRYARAEQSLRDLAASPSASDEVRQRASDAAAEARDRQIGRKLDESGRALADQQFSRAGESQESAADDIEDLVEQLRNRAPTDPAALAEALKQAADKLQALRDAAKQNAQQPAGEGKQQARADMAQQLSRLARELERLTAPAAGSSARSAGESMQDPNQPPDAEQQAEPKLAQARQEIENRLAQLQQQAEQRELDRLRGELAKLIPRQRGVIDDTIELEGQSPADPVAATEAVTSEERLLASELRVAISNVAARAVFQLALQGAAEDMQRAADRLATGDAGRATQSAELSALARMQHVADVLAPPPPSEQPPSDPQNGNNPQSGQQGQKPPPVIDLAEVKMLRWLQAELNGRTRQLEADLAGGQDGQTPDADAASYAERVRGEQRALAELVRQMLQRQAPPEPGQATPDL